MAGISSRQTPLRTDEGERNLLRRHAAAVVVITAPGEEGPGGVPLLGGVLARLVCRVVRRVEAGDHTIVPASPVAGAVHDDLAAAPLVYHDGTYHNLRRRRCRW